MNLRCSASQMGGGGRMIDRGKAMSMARLAAAIALVRSWEKMGVPWRGWTENN